MDPVLEFHINKPVEDEGLVWRRKTDTTKFMTGRSGDFLFVPFQCDICSFRNIKQRSPKKGSQADDRLLAYVCRATLDAFWSRAPGTVAGSVTGIRKMLRYSNDFKINPPFEPLGPWPVQDTQGLTIAIAILRASQEEGKNSSSYSQFDSIRKIRSAYGNHYEASKTAALNTWVLRSDKFNSFFTDSPARSEFFNRFMIGLRYRMGRDVQGDLALDFKILHKIMNQMKVEMLDSDTPLSRRRWLASSGAYFVVSFVLALRGNETLMLDLKGLKEFVKSGIDDETPHVVIPLLGRFKGEDYERFHILLSPNITDSGFEVRRWIEWLIEAKGSEGLFDGPAFSDKEGYVLTQQPFNDELFSQLNVTKENFPDLFPDDLKLEKISTSRSFRKGSTSRAQDLQLDTSLIDTQMEVILKGRRFKTQLQT